MLRKLVLFVFVVFLAILVSCTKSECSVSDDCATHLGSTVSCVHSVCVYQNSTSRAECQKNSDCVREGFDGLCKGGSCAFTEKPKLKYVTSTERVHGVLLGVASTFNQKFNVAQDELSVKITLQEGVKDVENLRIKRIDVEGYDSVGRQSIILGSDRVDLSLWQVGDVVSHAIRLDFPRSESQGKFQDVTLIVAYEYDAVSFGSKDHRSDSVRVVLSRDSFDWFSVHPTSCVCDDKDPLTIDSCDASFVCKHTQVQNVCGNFVCERGENKCSCARDCGPCNAVLGLFVKENCVENSCVRVLSSEQAPKTVIDERSFTGFKLTTRMTYANPFVAGKNVVHVELSLFDKEARVSQLRITTVQLREGNVLLSEVALKKLLISVGSKAILDLPLPSNSASQKEVVPRLVVNYEVTTDGGVGATVEKSSFEKDLERISVVTLE